MIDENPKLRCERRISELRLRIADLQNGSERGSGVLPSSKIIEFLKDTLAAWEARKRSFVESDKAAD